MSDPNPDELRRRLVEIDDELRELPADDFSRKHQLNTEGDQLRASLAALVAQESLAASNEWAERAARKASHSATDGELASDASMIKFLFGQAGRG